jgi:hypothetical protein
MKTKKIYDSDDMYEDNDGIGKTYCIKTIGSVRPGRRYYDPAGPSQGPTSTLMVAIHTAMSKTEDERWNPMRNFYQKPRLKRQRKRIQHLRHARPKENKEQWLDYCFNTGFIPEREDPGVQKAFEDLIQDIMIII